MNDHNLDDLIIDTTQPTNNKIKNFLTIVALFIVVLIVGIILSKTYTDADTDEKLSFDDNSTDIIAPELQLQETKKMTPPPKKEVLSTIMEEEKLKIPQVSKELTPPPVVAKEKEEETAPETLPTTEKKEVIPKPVTEVKKEEIKKPLQKRVVAPPKVEHTKPVVKHTTPKVPKVTSTLKYYVQVGSFKQNPSPRFLSVISSSGFRYHVSKPDTLGNKKLLIGPYKTRADVDKALVVVRDRIHKSAFVVQK